MMTTEGCKMSDDGLIHELVRENRSLMMSLHDSEKNVASLKIELKRISDSEVEVTLKFANSEKEITRLTLQLEDAEKEILRLQLALKS
jgi:predicted RNase H-like nuclease (RuvC/YqgF family)